MKRNKQLLLCEAPKWATRQHNSYLITNWNSLLSCPLDCTTIQLQPFYLRVYSLSTQSSSILTLMTEEGRQRQRDKWNQSQRHEYQHHNVTHGAAHECAFAALTIWFKYSDMFVNTPLIRWKKVWDKIRRCDAESTAISECRSVRPNASLPCL